MKLETTKILKTDYTKQANFELLEQIVELNKDKCFLQDGALKIIPEEIDLLSFDELVLCGKVTKGDFTHKAYTLGINPIVDNRYRLEVLFDRKILSRDYDYIDIELCREDFEVYLSFLNEACVEGVLERFSVEREKIFCDGTPSIMDVILIRDSYCNVSKWFDSSKVSSDTLSIGRGKHRFLYKTGKVESDGLAAMVSYDLEDQEGFFLLSAVCDEERSLRVKSLRLGRRSRKLIVPKADKMQILYTGSAPSVSDNCLELDISNVVYDMLLGNW